VYGGHGHSLPVAFFFPKAVMGKTMVALFFPTNET
jgi:hypothetical protein